MNELRHFQAYTNVAPVSPAVFIDAQGAANSSKTQQLLFACNLCDLDGYAADAGWFQLFDRTTAPVSGTTVPFLSLPILAAGQLPTLLPSLGPLPFMNGLYCAMSSTEAVYTAVATNFDVWGEVEQFEKQPSGLSVAGDLTTGVDSKVIWIDGSGPKKLVRVDVINGLSAVAYLMIFAKNVSNGLVPIDSIPLANSTDTQTFLFGTSGRDVFSESTAGVIQKACVLAVSTTNGTLTLDGGTLNKIRAMYK